MPTIKTNFQKSIEKLLKGDNVEQIALNISTQMQTGFDIQLSAQKGEQLDLEDKVLNAKTKVDNALMNFGKSVTDRNAGVQAYINAKYELEEAENNLNEQKKVQKWLEEASEIIKK